MTDAPIDVPPFCGDIALAAIHAATGEPCHLIMIVFRDAGPGQPLGKPAFVSTLPPPEAKAVLESIGGQIAFAGAPTVRQ